MTCMMVYCHGTLLCFVPVARCHFPFKLLRQDSFLMSRGNQKLQRKVQF